MVSFGEKAKIKKAGNLNYGRIYVITTVFMNIFLQFDTMCAMTRNAALHSTRFFHEFFISSYLQVNFLEFCHVIFTIFFSYFQVINKALQLS